jgi:GT2 family glycosyltransferase
VDVCVVRYHSDENRVQPGLRPDDRLLVHDNSSRNLGFAAGANRAAAQGRAALICFVNPDGDLTLDCLNKLEQAMAEPAVVAVGPAYSEHTPAVGPGGDAVGLPATCLVVRRSAFERVGGFDERLFMYHEDVDLSFRLAQLGRLKLVDDAFFPHDWTHRYGFWPEHCLHRNDLVVQRRYRSGANIGRAVRDAIFALRQHRWQTGLTRLTGVIDYLLRARRWR